MRKQTLIQTILALVLLNSSCETNQNTEKNDSTILNANVEMNYAYRFNLSSIYELTESNEGEFVIVLSQDELNAENIDVKSFYTIELHTGLNSIISEGVYSYCEYALEPMTFFAWHYSNGNKNKLEHGTLKVSISGNYYSFILENAENAERIYNLEYMGELEPFSSELIKY